MIIHQHLKRSSATEAFRAAVDDFLSTGRANDQVAFDRSAPAVKVERTLVKALVEYPELEIESIEIRGASGCEYFRGELMLRAADVEHLVRFDWDCRWKAEQNGWVDYFGFPDQIRAAREHGWDCFRQWEASPVPLPVG